MRKGVYGIIMALIFIFSALGIGALVFFPSSWNTKKNQFEKQARVIIPQNLRDTADDTVNLAELMAEEDSITAKVPLADGEVIVSVLNDNFDGSQVEKQFIAYRNLHEAESPIYVTYIDYDEASGSYKRVWSAPTAATQPGTVSLYTQDLLGDRSLCVLLSGMNGLGEHTLTIFRKNPSQAGGSGAANNDELFNKIAEFRIDGTISVKEVERSQAYQMGFGPGQDYTISAYGRDFESTNIMDQVEIVYAYNPGNGLFEQVSRTRIPGTQIEQRRVRELLGNPRAFEDFITGLWYYTTPEGTIDKRQYIYFSPSTQEIIFYGDETQQVFTWQNSAVTRYGLYVSSQNISISTLRRSIDIELESLESIKVRVFEDVRLPVRPVAGVNAPWDGSYRKAGPPEDQSQKNQVPGNTFIDAYYNGSIGKIHFLPTGAYELYSDNALRQGKYAFFYMDDKEVLELRYDGASGPVRETYLVSPQPSSAETPPAEDEPPGPPKTLSLLRVRIGTRGVEELYEEAISLTLVSE